MDRDKPASKLPERRQHAPFPVPPRELSPASVSLAEPALLSFQFMHKQENHPPQFSLPPHSTQPSFSQLQRQPQAVREASIITNSSHPTHAPVAQSAQSGSSALIGNAARPAPSPAPSAALLARDPARLRGQSVSFYDSDVLDRSRRFTISAQPLAVKLALALRQGLAAQLPTRKTSVHDVLPGFSRTNSALTFHPVARGDASIVSMLHALSRVDSPASDRPQSPADSLRFSPSPPPRIGVHSPKLASTLSVDIPGSRRGSHQGEHTAPISILRKGSTKASKKFVVASPEGPPVPFQQYLTRQDDRKLHLLLACTGSVATIKIPLMIDKLFLTFGENKISVQLVTTRSACHFLRGLKIHKDVKIWRDGDEWANFAEYDEKTTTASTCEPHPNRKAKSPYDKLILHNELRRWADIMLIAPLSANTLAKIACGMNDNLLTSIVRCWGPMSGGPTSDSRGQKITKKPILIAPAMNTFMYTHPLTSKHLKILASPEEGFGMEILKPVEKVLVCGDIGMGGMREWLDIVEILRRKAKVILAERAADMDMPLDEIDDEDKEEQDGEDDDDSDDEKDDEEEVSEIGELDIEAKDAKADERGGEGKDAGKSESLIFELSEDQSADLNKIQRTMSPLSVEAKSII